LNEGIVFTQESSVERGGSLVVSYHVLPSEWESEAIISQVVILYGSEKEKGGIQVRSVRGEVGNLVRARTVV
jgi:hypothetical protein